MALLLHGSCLKSIQDVVCASGQVSSHLRFFCRILGISIGIYSYGGGGDCICLTLALYLVSHCSVWYGWHIFVKFYSATQNNW